jgi:metallophosphoesterase (TIGR00282 family)
MTRILAIGDVMGKAGRRCLEALLPRARAEFSPDLVLVNGENAAGGFGLTEKIYKQFVEPAPAGLGIDAVTMGNHWHDKREIYQFMGRADRMVIPANMANVEQEDSGLKVLTGHNGTRFAVINLIGKAFMHGENRCPFKAADKLLDRVPVTVRIRIVDVHAEATSEKQALAWYLAGRVSLLYGTHVHVPTADERVLKGGTGFATDLGMTGPYDSVIGIRKEASIARLMTGEKRKWEPATDDPWLTGIVADVDEDTGRCTRVTRIRWEMGDAAKGVDLGGED